jgi:hypothetical protein
VVSTSTKTMLATAVCFDTKAFKLLQRITSLFETTFRDLGEPPAIALAKANLFVNLSQGAIVVARAGGGLEHLRKVFRDLKEMVDLS